jgi:hypothetical protein
MIEMINQECVEHIVIVEGLVGCVFGFGRSLVGWCGVCVGVADFAIVLWAVFWWGVGVRVGIPVIGIVGVGVLVTVGVTGIVYVRTQLVVDGFVSKHVPVPQASA